MTRRTNGFRGHGHPPRSRPPTILEDLRGVEILYVGLYHALPVRGAGQGSNEIRYPGYKRIGRARTADDWLVVDGVALPLKPITFPECPIFLPYSIAYWGVGSAEAGLGRLFYVRALPPFAIMPGDCPEIRVNYESREIPR